MAESQRRRILHAMVAVVAEKGYADARIADALEVGGISRKTFYELFQDKEDCFLAAYDVWSGCLVDAVTAAFESDREAPWVDRIRAALTALLDQIAENPAPARLCVVEVMAAGPKALARRDATVRQFTHFLDVGRAEGAGDLPGITSLALIGGINELLYSEILHGATARLPSKMPDLLQWIVLPYLGDARAEEERLRARELMRAPAAG